MGAASRAPTPGSEAIRQAQERIEGAASRGRAQGLAPTGDIEAPRQGQGERIEAQGERIEALTGAVAGV